MEIGFVITILICVVGIGISIHLHLVDVEKKLEEILKKLEKR